MPAMPARISNSSQSSYSAFLPELRKFIFGVGSFLWNAFMAVEIARQLLYIKTVVKKRRLGDRPILIMQRSNSLPGKMIQKKFMRK